jgi:aryl-alcohol dehydrogenase-like predicted oxidoreductase
MGTARYESIQIQWSLVSRDAERELVPAARQFGMGILVWSPLAAGFLSGKYKRDEAPPKGTRLAAWKDSWAARATPQNWSTLDTVQAVAKHHGVSPSAVSLAWLLTKREVSSVIVGARSVSQLKENLAAGELKLSPEDLKQLDKVSTPDWGYPYSFIGMREPW